MIINRLWRAIPIFIGCTMSLGAASAVADDFYKGKTVEIVIASGPGGFDFIGRLVARHLGEHIPGNPTVIAENMPGAGGLTATNFLYRRAKQDGTVLGQLPANVIVEDLVGAPGVAFKSASFNEIGRVASGINITVSVSGSKVRTIDDARGNQVPYATTAPASLVQILPTLANRMLGTKFKFVSGYTDTATTILAMERGEAEAATVGINSMYELRPGWVTNGQVNFILQYTAARSARLPDVPAITEFVTKQSDRDVLDLFLTAVTLGQHITAPPNVPADRLGTLRAAFDAMLRDPEFLKDVEISKIWFDPMNGLELQKLHERTFDAAVIARAKAIRAARD